MKRKMVYVRMIVKWGWKVNPGKNVTLRERFLQRIKEFCLFDDDFMSRVFDENIQCTELILRIILDKPDIRVQEVHTQREIKNLRGHSVRLDIEAKNLDGEPINVEIQRAHKGAEVKRARFNSSMIDANLLAKGEDYESLPESYVIFITESDVMGACLPIYHADRMILETGKPLRDGAHVIYVNGAYRDDSPIGRLMHDFSCKEPSDMYYRELAEQVKFYKEDPREVKAMDRVMEEIAREYAQEIAKEYAEEIAKEYAKEYIEGEKRALVLKFLKLEKLSFREIAECSNLSLKEVEEIAGKEGLVAANV